MRCPKCEYVSFDSAGRCRNCGYDFSLSHDAPADLELPIRTEREPEGPLGDFVLRRGRGRVASAAAPAALDLDRLRVTPAAGRDLPLFGDEDGADDEPLLVRPARSPLAVRRPTPDVVRLRDRARHARSEDERPWLELDAPPAEDDAAVIRRTDERDVAPDDTQDTAFEAPGIAARIGAAIVDLTLMGIVDVTVVYLTLQVAGLTAWELRLVPAVPMLGFFAILNGGYAFVLTAAGGRTLGKMITGLQVIDRDGGPVSLGQSAVRTASYLVSAAPAGIGFLLGVFGAERLTLHDRLAATRVVKSSQ